MKRFLLLLALLSGVASAADDLTPYGVPEVPGAQTTTITRTAYLVKYFNACKAPFYVAQHLVGANVGGNEPRLQFRADDSLSAAIRATNADYANSGFDKGHMAPAGDFQNDHTAMAESFILSNAVPQTPRLNRGSWKAIEIRTRAFAIKYNDIYVFSGGIYAAKPETIGSGVCVPVSTYKIIINKATGQSIGWIVPNVVDVKGRPEKFAVAVSEIEKQTGINFTPTLDAKLADQMKSKIGTNFELPLP